MNAIDLAERRLLPDSLVRSGMRRLVGKRLKAETAGDAAELAERFRELVRELDESPIAADTQAADRRHQVPASFFRLHLGPRMKDSCCLFATGRESLSGAEEAMLACYADRAALADGQRILDLGCGWGSFALWAAARFPHSTVVGLSHSVGQRQYVEAAAAQRGLTNLTIRTGDVVDVGFDASDIGAGFDRIVSIEMFERMKNYRLLFAKLAKWLADDGRVFVQVFANRRVAYHFQDRASDEWMSRHFLAGGTMPSFDLFKHFDDDLQIEKRWWISGRHYERTANDWLRHMDGAEDAIIEIFRATYGEADARIWFARWRMFYMAVAELFGFDDGRQWGVAHYRFARHPMAGIND